MQRFYPDYASSIYAWRKRYCGTVVAAAISHLDAFRPFLEKVQIPVRTYLEMVGVPADIGTQVLLPVLHSVQLVHVHDGKVSVIGNGEAYVPKDDRLNLLGYMGSEFDDSAVVRMAILLRGEFQDEEASYCAGSDGSSPMDATDTAADLTTRLAGRARMLAPLVPEAASKFAGSKEISGEILDVGCGSGWFSYRLLAENPKATAVLFDRENVLAVAREQLNEFCRCHPEFEGVRERVSFQSGDMFEELPTARHVLLFSVLHDWRFERAKALLQRVAAAVENGGRLWVHECFLKDDLSGPAEAAAYSAQLLQVTQGYLYSHEQLAKMLRSRGMAEVELARKHWKERESRTIVPTQQGYSLCCFEKEA